uniref:Autophagy-related protein 2 n=2 Tax=Eremothecium gossypii (strain ATCC 10895 / CBS 109.51 / FGSC 9923 / NRRL Y-1056) TaxID=284811 RepID=ATG2_EREGS|nr:RecName: Full=Autophagy-related protein 2 [Eremothecium gossypii ATCC 10895]
MSSWLPQNVQKRLLIYLLQQISIFSQIDTTNLDVSLGCRSQFAFHDVELNVDHMRVPHITVESGHISELELGLVVSGGLDITGDGLCFVVRPELSEVAGSHDLAQSLARSIMDLTNSMMQPLPEVLEGDEVLANSCSEAGDAQQPASSSALDKMRNKVLERALSNLTVRIINVRIQVLFPGQQSITVLVGSVELSTVDKTRRVDLQDICISHSELVPSPEQPDEFMSTSASNSIYMSAIDSLPFGSRSKMEENARNVRALLQMDKLHVTFQGISSVEDISIRDLMLHMGRVDVFLDAIIAVDIGVFEVLVQFVAEFQQDTEVSETSNTLQNYKRFRQEQNLEEDLQITGFTIEELRITLSQSVKVSVIDIQLRNRYIENSTVTVGRVTICDYDLDLLHIDAGSKPCLELTVDSRKLQRIISVDGDIHMDISSTFVSSLIPLIFRLQELGRGLHFVGTNNCKMSQEFKTQVETKTIILSLPVGDDTLQMIIQPISYELSLHTVFTDFISISKVQSSETRDIAIIREIKIGYQTANFQVKSYNLKLSETLLTSKLRGSVSSVELYCSDSDIKWLFDGLSPYQDMITPYMHSKPEVRKPIMNKSVRILSASSVIHRQNVFSDMVLLIERITCSLSADSISSFGNVKTELNSSLLSLNTDNSIIFHSSCVKGSTVFSDVKYCLFEPIKTKDVTKPALFVQRFENGKLKVNVQNTCIYYHAKWLDILDESKGTKSTPQQESAVPVPLQQRIEVKFHDCALSMHPYRLKSALLICVNRCILDISVPPANFKCIIRSPTFMLADDCSNMKTSITESWESLVRYYSKAGFAVIGKSGLLSCTIKQSGGQICLDIDVDRIDLSICADSFQCLIQTLIDIKPPVSFPDEKKYRTEPCSIPVFENVDDEFFVPKGTSNLPALNDMHIVDDFINNSNNSFSEVQVIEETEEGSPLKLEDNGLLFDEGHFNKEDIPVATDSKFFPFGPVAIVLHLFVRKASIKLHDGYDWVYTRRSISKVVDDLEDEVHKQDQPGRVETSLFDSIYLYATPDSNIKKAVSSNIQSEDIIAENYSSKMKLRPSKHHKILIELTNMKLTFSGYSYDEPTEDIADWSTDLLNSIDVEVKTFEIVDNVATSTWNKFLTELKEAHGGSPSMLALSISLVRPIDFLYATELIISAQVSPLRLHVDQDTLDFLIRFSEFKDARFDLIDDYPDIVYIQRFEVNSIDVKLDYKPKKVDYVGLKSGHTSELMNFFTLDGAKMTLKRVVLYGVDGLGELHNCLSSIWTPDITRSQLSGVLKGVTPLKSIITLGSGVKALVTVPLKEYRQDQRLTRSLQKGARDFLKTTSGELIRLGVRMASGTQAILENTEEFFGGQGARARCMSARLPEDELSPVPSACDEFDLFRSSIPRKQSPIVPIPSEEDDIEPLKAISLYADQPQNAQKGVKEAYGSLGKNLTIAYGAVRRAQRDARHSISAQDAATAFARATPIAFIRPMIGATEAVSKTLQGISNQMDRDQLVHMRDKYKQSSHYQRKRER